MTNHTGTGIDHPEGIAAGPDGALWFTNSDFTNDSIGRITTTGVVTNYTDPGISSSVGITAGPDGALWITSGNGSDSAVSRLTTSGVFTNYSGSGISNPHQITAGPDGALWFTNSGGSSIGRITTAGAITDHSSLGSPVGDRDRIGRCPLVHQRLRQLDRADHHCRSHFQLLRKWDRPAW